MNIPGQESAWPYANDLWIDIMGGSGWNPNPEKDPPSALPSPPEEARSGPAQHLLVVEDNEADIFLIQEAIAAVSLPVTVHVVRNGDQAIRFFDQADSAADAPCPALVLLDINLPRTSGYEVLKHLRNSARCNKAHVIAVSTSDAESDRRKMAELGANGYFRKPSEYADFMKLGNIVETVLRQSAGDSRDPG